MVLYIFRTILKATMQQKRSIKIIKVIFILLVLCTSYTYLILTCTKTKLYIIKTCHKQNNAVTKRDHLEIRTTLQDTPPIIKKTPPHMCPIHGIKNKANGVTLETDNIDFVAHNVTNWLKHPSAFCSNINHDLWEIENAALTYNANKADAASYDPTDQGHYKGNCKTWLFRLQNSLVYTTLPTEKSYKGP